MIPTFYNVEVVEASRLASYTYYIDPMTKRIVGHVDGLAAVVQAVTKLIWTERYAKVIYNDQYGAEIEDLIGKSPDYVKSVLESRIVDALTSDDRFISLQNFVIDNIEKEKICFKADVLTNHGNFTIER